MAIQIVITKTFTDASVRVPQEIRSRLMLSISSFFNNPLSMGLHQEKLKGTKTDYYSMKVNDNYRIIYFRPDKGGIVFLLYVDKHDNAYHWADTHTIDINVNGGIQVYGDPPAVSMRDASGQSHPVARLFSLSDEDFQFFHVPKEYVEMLRAKVFTAKQLLGFKQYLSEETYHSLEQIVNGFDIEEEKAFYKEYTAVITPPPVPEPIYKAYGDEDLAKLGVPIEYLSMIKAIRTASELSSVQEKLPEDAVQNLYALKSGEPLEALIKRSVLGSKPTESFSDSLKNANSKQECALIESNDMLQQLLEMPMDKWRVFLHPEQRYMVERHYNGPARVLGGAGTGKTVITIHRAKYLARECKGSERVLVTTFSTTLADDITKRLEMICSQAELEKITVSNVDTIARNVAKAGGIFVKYNIKGRDGKGQLDAAWEKAVSDSGKNLRFGWDFYAEEWQDVIQAQNIKSLQEYLDSPRNGRGKQRLDKKTREDVWTVFETYRKIMLSKNAADIDMAENLAVDICRKHPELCRYKSIIVDECQDLRSPAFRMLRALAGSQHQDDLFFAGDTRQKIYNGNASLSQCGIAVVGRSSQLKMNYRTTCEIYEAACKLQQGYQYDDIDSQINIGDKSVCIIHGDEPSLRGFYSFREEIDAVAENIRAKQRQGVPLAEMCIVARTNKLVERWREALETRDIPVYVLNRDQKDDKSIPAVRVATMHRVKGMEFQCMYIVSINADTVPLPIQIEKAYEDEELIESIMKQEANLLAVAMTRAKRYAWISYSGSPSELLSRLKE